MCSEIADLAEHIHDLECISILETGITFMVGHLDKKTRDCLFEVVNRTTDAKRTAKQRCLVTPEMFRRLHDDKSNIQAGLMAKSVVDLLIDTTNECHTDQAAKDIIFKSVVLRLAFELSHKTLDEVVHQLAPIRDQKWRTNSRDMYG